MKNISILFIFILILLLGCTTSKLDKYDANTNISAVIYSFGIPEDMVTASIDSISMNSSNHGLDSIVQMIAFSQSDIAQTPAYEKRSIVFTISNVINKTNFNQFIDGEREFNSEANEPSDFQELYKNDSFIWIYSTRGDLILENTLSSEELNKHVFSYNIYFYDGSYFVGSEMNNVFKSEKDLIIEQMKKYLTNK